MARLPVVAHIEVHPSPAQRRAVEQLAEQLLSERADLRLPEALRALAAETELDGATLHLDDQSDIRVPALPFDSSYIQDRARLRAGDGDLVACAAPPVAGYEDYCRERLGLGAPEWLHPVAETSRRCLAHHCWVDRRVRRALIRALRSEALVQVHPMMGSLAVWQLAAMLRDAAHRPLQVLAPHPGLTRWVNDKVAFAETVTRLFGQRGVPDTRHACNLAVLSRHVQDLARGSRVVTLKLPDSAGGFGNLIVESDRFRGRKLASVRTELRRLLAPLGWEVGSELVVASWESDVLVAPSAQLWIPPETSRPPVLEGLFEQRLAGPTHAFVGMRPATLPAEIARDVAERCWLLGLLYQRLGYAGRCSFDAIVVGDSPEQSRTALIECNGRWGGTSLPMTLLNRLFGDWASRAFVVRCCRQPGVGRLGFPEVLDHFGADLYDAKTGLGRLVLFDPARMYQRSAVEMIALGDGPDEALHFAREEFPARLQELLKLRGIHRR